MSSRSPYIVGRAYDWAFFLLPPLASLLLGIAIAGSDFANRKLLVVGRELTAAQLAIGVLIHAHLVAVFFRSHGNQAIRRLHPWRFLLLPPLLFVVIRSSPWIAVSATVVVTWWDVVHSGAQTFGFGRIYDRNLGSPPALGRWLDYGLNQLLYAGPILGGVTLVDHLVQLHGFADLGSTLFSSLPLSAPGWRRSLRPLLLAMGSLYLVYYLYAYLRLRQQGYRVSRHKLFLVVTTGACSLYTWGYNSFGQAFFIMNLFHAVQYLALVFATERPSLPGRLGGLWPGRGVALLLYLAVLCAYGLAAVLIESDLPSLWTLTIVVSLLHFFYDGFIWSVGRRQV